MEDIFITVIEESLGLSLSNLRETTESTNKFCTIKLEMIYNFLDLWWYN